ncbi:MAG: VWA domain-containing protein, partial [Planctomycetota bacterium]|nr:VWA domain-containing protein [Planctomycetota bacterium]
VLRTLVVIILVGLLARPTLTRKNEHLTVITVLDRSQSIPHKLLSSARQFLSDALTGGQAGDLSAVVDVAEVPSISRLPSSDPSIRERNTTLTGRQSNLADGVQMAMAIAPPDTAAKILLVSDGNETEGDLVEAARIAAANSIPIDVLAIRYTHSREVVFKRLAAPIKARSGQTVTLRFILHSTARAEGRLKLTVNGKAVDLDPDSPDLTVPVELKPGTNVKTVSMPVGMRGMHEFEAEFIPDDPAADGIVRNNRASAMTFVAGKGYVLILDGDGKAGASLVGALQNAGIEAKYTHADNLPDNLARLMEIDAVVLSDTDNSLLTFQQQEMLCRYVTELGGGLVMTGGPASFGAGGWIGSPVAKILPLDLDPPQKKQMPKGALVLIMHACEMPRGNFWGKNVAIAAVNSLSRRDLVGVLDYKWGPGNANWVFPLGIAGDKNAVTAAIKKMEMGDMPDFAAPMQAAYKQLLTCNAGQKHIIIISDGDPAPPSRQLLNNMRKAGITCTGIGVFPHSSADVQSLQRIAKVTGGRFYNVKNPNTLPQIFIKEAQVVSRSLIVEETFAPKITFSISEILKSVDASLPSLDGYVLTGPKGGLTQLVLTGPGGDPLLATGQAGLGRCAAFTSSADSRWASQWLKWGGFERFWEQTVRWVSKSSQPADCEIFADVNGRDVTITIESVDAEGKFVRFSDITGQVIAPDMSAKTLAISQVGPGRYRAGFRSSSDGSHLITVRYVRSDGKGKPGLIQSAVTIPYAPEYRDLSDNFALLSEVARMTGGRMIGGSSRDAKLFDRTGVKFPLSATPLTMPLMLIWLGLFLLDVAVRRIAIDVRSLARRAWAAIPSWRPSKEAGTTLDRLKLRRQKLKEQLAGRKKDAAASRKYEAGGKTGEGELPMSKTAPPKPKPEETPEEPKKPEPEETHLQQLLKAKRQAKDRFEK